MKKISYIVLFLALAVGIGAGAQRASALSSTELQALCVILSCTDAQKTALNALVTPTAISAIPVTTSTSNYQFTRNLYVGISGDDVYQLQVFLNKTPSTRIATTGAGSLGNETRYYGPATASAVRVYQASKNIQTTGTVGPMTRASLNGEAVIASTPNTTTGFETPPMLLVTTGSPTGVSATTASLNGLLTTGTFGYYKTTSVFFKYGAGSVSTLPYTSAVMLPAGTASIFSGTLTGLSPSTIYSYQACAVNAVGTVCGAPYVFTTLSGTSSTSTNTSLYACSNNVDDDYDGYIDYPTDSGCYGTTDNDEYNTNLPVNTSGYPVVTVAGTSAITPSSANVSVSYNGSGSQATVWLTYGTNSSSLSQSTTSVGGNSTGGVHSFALSGLSPATTYYLQAYVSNTSGQSTSSITSFTTPAGAPTILSATPHLGSSYSTATVDIAYNGNGGGGSAWVMYGTSPNNLSSRSSTESTVSGSSTESVTLSGLFAGTYYFQAHVQNSAGETLSSVLSFQNLQPV